MDIKNNEDLKKSYYNLLIKICKIENLDENEIEKAKKELELKISSILGLREFAESNCKEYTDISFFFVIYLIVLSVKFQDNYISEFEESNFLRIKKIIEDSDINRDLYYFNNNNEYIEKYSTDYNLLMEGLIKKDKLSKGNRDILIEKFWKIFNI